MLDESTNYAAIHERFAVRKDFNDILDFNWNRAKLWPNKEVNDPNGPTPPRICLQSNLSIWVEIYGECYLI